MFSDSAFCVWVLDGLIYPRMEKIKSSKLNLNCDEMVFYSQTVEANGNH